jgi:hypothetical protein
MDNSLATELIAELKALTKRLFALLVIVTVFAFVSNFVWIYAWFQPTDERSVTVDGKDGIANYIGKEGDITNGKDCSERNQEKDDTTSEIEAEAE